MKTRGADSRREARASALQALYQWELTSGSLDEILAESWAIQGRSLDVQRDAMAARLVRGVVGHLDEIDRSLEGAVDNWSMNRLATVDRLILRLGAYELAYEPDTPRAVVINEAIELAKMFGAGDTPKFVNGVLDSLARRLESATSG